MAWIESHQSLATHRKTARLARQLSISKVTAIGHLHALWWWCMDNAQTGELSDIDIEDIADGAMWEGAPSELIEGLVYAGFVDRDDGRLIVHDWMDYAGRLIERRMADAARKRAARHPEPVQGTSAGHPDDGVRTVPNPTIPNQPNPTQPKGSTARAASPSPKAVPKPNKLAEVIDAIRAGGGDVSPSKADAAAVKGCSAAPALIAEAHLAAFEGRWPPGDSWLRDNLSLQAVCKRIDGYRAWKAQEEKANGIHRGDDQSRGVPGKAGGPAAAGDGRRRDERFERMLEPQREWARQHGYDVSPNGALIRGEDAVQPV